MPLFVYYLIFFVTLVPLSKTLSRGSAVGEPCTIKSDCRTQFAYCYNQDECRCMKNYTLDSKSERCIPECSSDRGCPNSNFTCLSFVCKCDRHYIKMNEICEQIEVDLGKKCRVVDDCVKPNTSEVQCLNDVCTCGNGYRHIGNNLCVPVYLGEPCNNSNECNSVNGSVQCYQGICQCAHNFIKSGLSKTCLRLAMLNQFCEETLQCIRNNSKCIDSKCQCIKGYRIENATCIRSADLGENCTTSRECNPLFGATHCNKGVCDCKAPEFVKSTHRHNSCVRVSKYAYFCEEMNQCPGNSSCIKGKCDCEDGFHWENNTMCQPNTGHLIRGCVWTTVIMAFIYLIY